MAAFGVWDYVVFILMLTISASIGVYYRFAGGKQKTNAEYFLANRSTPVLTVACSLMASFLSSVTLFGVAMENYQYGTIYVIINLSYAVGTPIAAYLFLPVFFQLQTTSAYEYLQLRFGKATRTCASIVFSLQTMLYMGVVLFTPALALEAVTNINRMVAILIIGAICTFYSTIGGLKAVMVTDIFQSVLMFASVYLVIIFVAIRAGGLGPIWATAVEGGRVYFNDFDPDPTKRHTWWSLMIGGLCTFLSLNAVNQIQIQRLLTVKSLRASQTAMWVLLPFAALLILSCSFSGLAIYYMYSTCDPLLQGRITSRDQLMPLIVVDTMNRYPGLTGLFVSGIFSACLSTVSSALNSLAAVTVEDYVKPAFFAWKGRPLENSPVFLSKAIAFSYGVVCIGIAFIAQNVGGLLQVTLTIFGVVGGPLLGLFTLGMFVPGGRQRGAITGLAVGLVCSLILGLGQPKPRPPELTFSLEDCTEFGGGLNSTLNNIVFEPDTDTYYPWLFRISYMWYGVVGFAATFLIGWLSSIVLDAFGWGGEHLIYLDDKKLFFNTKLFTPPLAKRLEARNAKQLKEDVKTAVKGK